MTPEDFNNPPHLPPCQAIVEFKVGPRLECGVRVWWIVNMPPEKCRCCGGRLISVGTELACVSVGRSDMLFIPTSGLYTSQYEAEAEAARRNGA